MSRPRNNITRLSGDARRMIAEMLDDGATYDEIRAEQSVAEEAAEKELALHNSSFAAYRDGDEFKTFCELRRKWAKDSGISKVAAAMIGTDSLQADIANFASYEITRRVLRQLEDGQDVLPKDLAHLMRVIKAAESRGWEKEKAGMAAKIAELSANLARIAGSKHAEGLSEDALSQIEERAKLL